MTAYLVEVHATFHEPSAEHLRVVEQWLRSADGVLPEPAPAVLTDEGQGSAVLQFAVTAGNEVRADATGRALAESAVANGGDDEPLADVGLVSARRLGEHDADDG